MTKLLPLVLTTSLLLVAGSVQAAEVCKASMMGRVCFEEGSPEATAAHMKGDAVAEAAQRKAEADAATKKVAEK